MHTSLIIAIPTTETFHRSGDNLQWVAAPKLPRLVGMAEGRQTIKCEYLQVYSTDGWHVIHHAHTHTHTHTEQTVRFHNGCDIHGLECMWGYHTNNVYSSQLAISMPCSLRAALEQP